MIHITPVETGDRRNSLVGLVTIWACGACEFFSSHTLPASAADEPTPLTLEQRREFNASLNDLLESIVEPDPQSEDLARAWDEWADVDVCRRAVQWGLDYNETYSESDRRAIQQGLDLGNERVRLLAQGKSSWTDRKGKVIRGLRSRIDDSAQPYGVIIPASYDPQTPTPLHVVLHGSVRPVGMVELRFLQRFVGDDPPPDVNYIELHPLGRVENCYRWAGETDVFEAIEATCRNYNIDRNRIVLRGMSMGASGTWHLGLKYPDTFVALGPYCGYVDTREFSKTPLGNFIVVKDLPDYQSRALHMLDSIDYAANAGVVPAIAAMGEKDIFFDAHVLMGDAQSREGLMMTNLISPDTGHVIDPVVHAEQLRLIDEHVDRGLDHVPPHIRFVTWTLKYNDCHWLEVLRLQKHYERAEIDAELQNDGDHSVVTIMTIKNIDRLAIDASGFDKPLTRVDITGQPLDIEPASTVILTRDDNGWHQISDDDPVLKQGKRPGVQGPIDDAFTSQFICVMGTGKPWFPQTEAWSEARSTRFHETWRQYMRGDMLFMDDVDVTDEIAASCHLILFGDPGSNEWIAKSLPDLPLKWTKETVQIGTHAVPSKDHVPVLIAPNPFDANGKHYVVLNTGHTFGEAEFAAVNYLLFPRLGDWAILKSDINLVERTDPHIFYDPAVVHCGYFDEDWK